MLRSTKTTLTTIQTHTVSGTERHRLTEIDISFPCYVILVTYIYLEAE
jgi:hypothetical protein